MTSSRRLVSAGSAGIFFLFALAVVLFSSCGTNSSTTDDTPPSAPVAVPRSADNIYPQRGIRAEAAEGDLHAVRIEWYRNPEPDVDGYRVWRIGEFDTTASGTLNSGLMVVDLPNASLPQSGSVLSYDDRGGSLLPVGGRTQGYYWQVEAYDQSGNTSGRSSPQYFRLLYNVTNLSVVREGPGLTSLSCSIPDNPNDVLLSYAMLRVFPKFYGPDSVMWYYRAPWYGGQNATVYLNFDSTAARQFIADTTYIWQVNLVADQPTPSHRSGLAGSAIQKSFVYQN